MSKEQEWKGARTTELVQESARSLHVHKFVVRLIERLVTAEWDLKHAITPCQSATLQSKNAAHFQDRIAELTGQVVALTKEAADTTLWEKHKALETVAREAVEVADLIWEYVDETEIADSERKGILLSMVTQPGLKDALGIPR